MKKKNHDNAENEIADSGTVFKRLIIMVGVLLVVVLGVLAWELRAYLFPQKEIVSVPVPIVITQQVVVEVEGDDGEENQLFDILDCFPEKLYYGQALPDTQLIRGDGTSASLQGKYRNKNLVIMFWGSWCPYCKEQLQYAAEFRKIIDSYSDTELILIDKLDAKKNETIEKAQEYLRDNNIGFDCYYDTDLKIYTGYGLKLIPTTIIIDTEGIVRYMNVEGIKSAAQLEDAVRGVREGFGSITQSFVEKYMLSDSNLVRINVNSDATNIHPLGWDSLSESQGLLMNYALEIADKALFDRTWDAVRAMINSKTGLIAWYISESGKQAGSNSFVDDVRILHMLKLADDKWGGYAEEVCSLSDAVLKYSLKDGRPASFYDFAYNKAGREISLYAADLKAFRDLAEIDERWNGVYECTLEIVSGGMISEELPLYYHSFSYDKGTYSDGNLNTSEALYTFYQLAQVELLSKESIEWLKNKIRNHELYALYTIDGNPVQYYEYESTAAFGLAMLIGIEIGDNELITLARINMEKTRNYDKALKNYGSFAHEEDASDVNVFDELIPMLAYAKE